MRGGDFDVRHGAVCHRVRRESLRVLSLTPCPVGVPRCPPLESYSGPPRVQPRDRRGPAQTHGGQVVESWQCSVARPFPSGPLAR